MIWPLAFLVYFLLWLSQPEPYNIILAEHIQTSTKYFMQGSGRSQQVNCLIGHTMKRTPIPFPGLWLHVLNLRTRSGRYEPAITRRTTTVGRCTRNSYPNMTNSGRKASNSDLNTRSMVQFPGNLSLEVKHICMEAAENFGLRLRLNATPFSQARNTRFSKEGTMPYRGGNRDESAYVSVIGYCIL